MLLLCRWEGGWFPRGNGSVGVVGVVAAEGGAAEGGAVEGRLANLK